MPFCNEVMCIHLHSVSYGSVAAAGCRLQERLQKSKVGLRLVTHPLWCYRYPGYSQPSRLELRFHKIPKSRPWFPVRLGS